MFTYGVRLAFYYWIIRSQWNLFMQIVNVLPSLLLHSLGLSLTVVSGSHVRGETQTLTFTLEQHGHLKIGRHLKCCMPVIFLLSLLIIYLVYLNFTDFQDASPEEDAV